MSASPFASSRDGRASSCARRAFDKHWICWDSSLEPLLDQFRLISEDRLTNEVLEGHRAVKGHGQLQRRQRRATEVEKVIASADLLLGNAKHPGPCGRESALRRGYWLLAALPRDAHLSGQGRQC